MRKPVLIALAFAAVAAPALAASPGYLDDRSTPEAVVASFYNAIGRQEYTRAWSYYEDGQGVPAFKAFVSGLRQDGVGDGQLRPVSAGRRRRQHLLDAAGQSRCYRYHRQAHLLFGMLHAAARQPGDPGGAAVPAAAYCRGTPQQGRRRKQKIRTGKLQSLSQFVGLATRPRLPFEGRLAPIFWGYPDVHCSLAAAPSHRPGHR